MTLNFGQGEVLDLSFNSLDEREFDYEIDFNKPPGSYYVSASLADLKYSNQLLISVMQPGGSKF
jgi:hypothetical protein